MSISDMMSGLMLVFLFIAISFMIKVEAEKEKMKSIAIEYRDTKANLNEALYAEFENDLQTWDATITKNNTVIFNSPKVLFEVSKSDLKMAFKSTLDEFFPRYIAVLTSKEYRDEIEELRVEGHTSNTWESTTSKKEIYLNNMKLSQSRAFKVLTYCYSLKNQVISENRQWLEQNFRANGMAFSKLKVNKNARRVEFTIQMKSEDKVYKILH